MSTFIAPRLGDWRTRATVALVALLLVTACSAQATSELESSIPGVVALVNASAPGDDLVASQFCGGVLVRADEVLTAAHCVVGRAPSSIDAVVGADNLCRGRPVDGDRMAVARIRVDAQFDPTSGRHDLARLFESPVCECPRTLVNGA